MSHGFIPTVFMNRAEHINVYKLTVTSQYTRVTEEVRLSTLPTRQGWLHILTYIVSVHTVTSDELCGNERVV